MKNTIMKKMVKKSINRKAIRDTPINTIAIGLTGAGAAALTSGKYIHGAILILAGAGLEYLKYHWRLISNSIEKKKKKGD